MNCPYCSTPLSNDIDCEDCHVMFTDISRFQAEGHYHTIDGINYVLVVSENNKSTLRMDTDPVKFLRFNFRVDVTPKTAVDIIKKLLKLQAFI